MGKGGLTMETRERQRAVEALTRAVRRLEVVAIRMQRTAVAMAARAGSLQIQRRRLGVPRSSRQLATCSSPRANAPRASRPPFRGEIARADARGRLRVRR